MQGGCLQVYIFLHRAAKPSAPLTTGDLLRGHWQRLETLSAVTTLGRCYRHLGGTGQGKTTKPPTTHRTDHRAKNNLVANVTTANPGGSHKFQGHELSCISHHLRVIPIGHICAPL